MPAMGLDAHCQGGVARFVLPVARCDRTDIRLDRAALQSPPSGQEINAAYQLIDKYKASENRVIRKLFDH
jgi:hypothetical protein